MLKNSIYAVSTTISVCVCVCMYMYACMCIHTPIIYQLLLLCYSSGRPLSPVLENYTATDTTLWFNWTHNKVCFRDCIVYNISWGHSSSDMVEKSMVIEGTNYTISDLIPGQTYSVQICAVCEGYSPNCTEPTMYRTTVQGELQPHCFMHVYLCTHYVNTSIAFIVLFFRTASSPGTWKLHSYGYYPLV